MCYTYYIGYFDFREERMAVRFIDIDKAVYSGKISHICGVANTVELHTHNYYEFFVVTNGISIHRVNGADIIIGRGTLTLIRPPDVHCYDYYLSNDIKLYNQGIRIELFDELSKLYGGDAASLVDRPLPKHVKIEEYALSYLVSLIERYNAAPDGEKKTLMRHIVATVLYYMIYTEETDQKSFLPEWLSELLESMKERGNFVAGLPRLLELSGYSQEYVNRSFRRYLNLTPTQYVNRLRLKLAAELLKDTEINIASVAAECGFNNLSHFYAEFNRVYGTSPRKM